MNKRRFRKSLAQNAIYMKYKRLIPINSSDVNVNPLFTFNFNGNEIQTDERAVIHTYDSGTSAFTGYRPNTTMPSLDATFDQNRCAAVKIKFLPSLPAGAVTAGYQPAYLLRDRDGIDQQLSGTLSSPSILQEQINGVKTLNMYRPFKAYMKALKYRVNTRIPTETPAFASAAVGYSPNTNLAGQWKRVGEGLSESWTLSNSVNRGSQLAVVFQRPAGLTGPYTLGNLEVTTYYVYKDRR